MSGIQLFTDRRYSYKHSVSKRLYTINITVLYDSVSMMPDLETGKGFSCYIQIADQQILFDTGFDGSSLLNNMKYHAIDPVLLHKIFISHNRSGHVGGLNDILAVNQTAEICIPNDFPAHTLKMIGQSANRIYKVKEPEAILPGFFTLGEFVGTFREQALAIRSSKGIVILVGCAHHGNMKILNKVQELFPGESIFLVLGGFHFVGLSEAEKQRIVKFFIDSHVQNIAPCHCCEEACRKKFQTVYQENYIEMGVGAMMRISQTGLKLLHDHVSKKMAQ